MVSLFLLLGEKKSRPKPVGHYPHSRAVRE